MRQRVLQVEPGCDVEKRSFLGEGMGFGRRFLCLMMNRASVVMSGFLVMAASWAQAGDWVTLFDGKTLDGWKQANGTATYEVVDGSIVGTTVEGSPNSFLFSEKEYGDFELEFEVKVDDALNSGVQIRSRQKTAADEAASAKGKAKGKGNPRNDAAGRVFGPQVEIESSPGQSGWIYGEATGLGWLSPEPNDADPKVNAHSHMKNGEWNQYRVVAKGARIQTFINGEAVADLTHEDIFKTHPKGYLGLQVHGIKPGTGPYSVAWKNIRIKEL
jgi:hypothetical protein